MLPCRDGVGLDAPLELLDLPNGKWTGNIAFLDRDGVLNIGSEDYINKPEDLVILPGAADCVARLRQAGFRICVVTNQSPVGRGLWSSENLSQIHEQLRMILLESNSDAILDLILHSPWAPWDGSWARKPNPGMLEAGRQILDAAENSTQPNLLFDEKWMDRPDESNSIMVGDREVDMIAASRYGVKGFRCNSQVGISEVIEIILGGTA
ncbi:MAG: HAD-IIIA family hydrolase [Euryarchaeota archaeon]|jgi:histidinol-phosphate phosphatase family protein|nr:HAD-IIIA family hydrolase [Euryarchaeota archaeon]MBT3654434.1 HAD-IIIA family hydrolase [Euryarchaeota archaeon]MBT3757562.1 HAD-IIIA family hydrolase [Euryarchaeota archaeon]MBT4050654.1 HAD-IIIA family hydrolase [Euryarchaeota archaeon]MBT4346419.1 HAD-IIIA family hydrolase [Euryarchaeota archaeon]|tara:strand:+ start:4725 stop:5351 length:627 start_codon:yes stop_codon:yes gene_type:complete